MADSDDIKKEISGFLRDEATKQDQPTKQDQQIAELEKRIELERDGRQEDRFIFIVIIVLLLDVVFFSVIPSSGGPIALLILELLILIPLARRMGMEEIELIISRVLGRIAEKT